MDLIARVRCLSNAPSVGVLRLARVCPRPTVTAAAAWRARATLIEVPHGPDLYSTDRVHPNALGHARIAERVRGYLSRLPRDRAYASDYDCQAVRARGVLPAARRSMPVARDGAVASRAAGALVDDSPPPHLVHKHGWASTTTLAPTSPSPSRRA